MDPGRSGPGDVPSPWEGVCVRLSAPWGSESSSPPAGAVTRRGPGCPLGVVQASLAALGFLPEVGGGAQTEGLAWTPCPPPPRVLGPPCVCHRLGGQRAHCWRPAPPPIGAGDTTAGVSVCLLLGGSAVPQPDPTPALPPGLLGAHCDVCSQHPALSVTRGGLPCARPQSTQSGLWLSGLTPARTLACPPGAAGCLQYGGWLSSCLHVYQRHALCPRGLQTRPVSQVRPPLTPSPAPTRMCVQTPSSRWHS